MPWSKSDLPPSVKNKGWSAHQIDIFVHAANAALEEYGDDGKAIAVGTSAAEKAAEKKNANQFPRLFYCRHMQPGICGYDKETVLIDTDTVKRMMPTGVGKPVYIHHQDVDLENLKEKAAGYVTESFYNETDGWAWFRFLAIDDECYEAIANGWAVSNAYIPTEWGAAGTKNNCPYDREVLNGNFTHLAIVPDPRYEGARIFSPDEFKVYQDSKKRELEELQNSKPTKGKTMFKLFKNTRQEVSTIDEDTMVELQNGKTVSVAEMVNAMKKNSEDEKKKDEKENSDQMVDVSGEKMPLKELVNKYEKMCAKKNDAEDGYDDEDEEKKRASEKKNKKAKKNADDAADDDDDGRTEKEKDADEKGHKDEVDDEKKNAKHFEELRNAHLKAGEAVQVVETSMDKLERGKQLFSRDA